MSSFHYVGIAVLTAKSRKALKQAVTEAAEDLVKKAQEATPVDTGTLQSSIHVAGVSGQGNANFGAYTATVSTGGEADQYAVFVHEGTSRGMPAHKFLERPLQENVELYTEFLAKAAREQF